MGRYAARYGDEIDHGGQIISGSSTVLVDGRYAARYGDKVLCSIHGETEIVSGSDTITIDGLAAARIGDVCACGAVIITGSDDVEYD